MLRRFLSSRKLRYVLGLLLLLLVVIASFLFREMRQWPHMPTRGAMLWAFGVPVSYQTCGFHTGQDWFGAAGAPIYAVEAGEVVYVGPLWLDGPGQGRGPHSIILLHPGGYYTTYSHNSAALVSVGARVRRGEQIAEMGQEGYARSPHLHLEKVFAPFTGNWQEPFIGCEGYVDPGNRWSPF